QAEALTQKLAAIHATPGIASLAIPPAGRKLDQGIGIRRPAQGDISVPLAPARCHRVALAIVIIIGPGLAADHTQVALLAADRTIEQPVEAAVGARQQTGMQARAEFAEAFRLALEQDGAGR